MYLVNSWTYRWLIGCSASEWLSKTKHENQSKGKKSSILYLSNLAALVRFEISQCTIYVREQSLCSLPIRQIQHPSDYFDI